MDNSVTININLTGNALKTVDTFTSSLDKIMGSVGKLSKSIASMDFVSPKAAKDLKQWTQIGDVLSATRSVIDNFTPSAATTGASASSTVAAAAPTAAENSTKKSTGELAALDLAFILNGEAALTWQQNISEKFNQAGNTIQDFISKGLSIVTFGLQLGVMTAQIAGAYTALKSINLTQLITQTKLFTTVKSLCTKTLDIARRGMYIYQMQVLTARAAVVTTTGATKILNMVMAASPWMLAIMGVAALCAGIYSLVSSNNEATMSNKHLNASLEEMERNVTIEQLTLDRLFGALAGVEEGSAEWLSIRDQINEKYGSYLDNMGSEIKTAEDARLAYQNLTLAIRETARQRALEKAIGKAGEEYAGIESEKMTEIRTVLFEKFGKEEGTATFVRIRDAMRKGEKLPEDLIKTIAESSAYQKNIIFKNLWAISRARNKFEDAVQTAQDVMGIEKAVEKQLDAEKTNTTPATQLMPKGSDINQAQPATGTNTTPPASSGVIGQAIGNSGSTDSGNTGGTIKNITVTIEKLIDKFEISTTNLREDAGRIRDMVASALTDAVNDLNTAL